MNREDLRRVVRQQPFEPLELVLSDGRTVVLRHPDQVVITHRTVFVGLVELQGRHRRLASPARGDAVAKDYLWLDLMHVVSAAPLAHRPATRRRRRSA